MAPHTGEAGGALPPAFVIADLTPHHAAQAAALHMAGQPGTFLSSLGPGVLTALYTALPATRAGFGFAALDGDAARGFTAATVGVGRLFLEIGTTRLGTLLPPLLAQLARRPALVARTAQTLLYPLLVRDSTSADDQAGSPSAELLAIMVEPAWRSRGVGAQLLARLLDECRARDVRVLDVTVDATNDGAQRFYIRHGFGDARRFMLYGRPMLHLRRAVSPAGG